MWHKRARIPAVSLVYYIKYPTHARAIVTGNEYFVIIKSVNTARMSMMTTIKTGKHMD
jgi:hypothetical protein